MIVIVRNGQRIVIDGWRAWVIAIPVLLLIAAFAVVLLGLVLGIALSVASFLLFAIPVALVLGLLFQAFQPRR
jgi:hypothetical protein